MRHRQTRSRRPLAGTLGGIGVLALLIATSTQPVLGAPTAPVAPAPPDEYAAQQIDWKRCFEAGGVPAGLPSGSELLECGSFRAPRDWAAPDGGVDVTVAVSRLRPVAGRAQGSLLTNPGGPGGPGRTMPLFFLETGRKKLLASQEIVGIDVRGTGDSTNVTCAGQAATGVTLDPRDRSVGSTEVILDAAEYTARACQQAAGDLGRFVTTGQTVRDLDLLRHLLGRERINWLGYSGGTWLGAYYATYFPDRVGRFVLDSNTDFTAPWQATFNLQPLGFQRRFEVDFLPYVATYDSHFHLGATPAEVEAAYEALRAQLAAEPLELEELTVYAIDLDLLLIGAMYTKTSFQSAAETIVNLRAAASGRDEGSGPAAGWRHRGLVVQVNRARELARFGGMLPLAPDAFEATFLSVICNDSPWEGDRQTLLAESARQGEAYPLEGWSTLANPCIFWNRTGPVAPVPDGEGVPPVLMVQNERDPATPTEGARHAWRGFAGARLLTVLDEGDHGAYAIMGNSCVNDVVEAYLVDGVVPDDGTCPGTPIPAPVPVPDPGLLDRPLGGTVQGLVAILARIAGPLPL